MPVPRARLSRESDLNGVTRKSTAARGAKCHAPAPVHFADDQANGPACACLVGRAPFSKADRQRIT